MGTEPLALAMELQVLAMECQATQLPVPAMEHQAQAMELHPVLAGEHSGRTRTRIKNRRTSVIATELPVASTQRRVTTIGELSTFSESSPRAAKKRRKKSRTILTERLAMMRQATRRQAMKRQVMKRQAMSLPTKHHRMNR